MTERQLQDAVVACATLLGWRVYHTYDSRRSAKGFPDLTMVRGPRVIVAELKTERGALTDEQEDWIRAFEKTTVECYVWRPWHWINGVIDATLT